MLLMTDDDDGDDADENDDVDPGGDDDDHIDDYDDEGDDDHGDAVFPSRLAEHSSVAGPGHKAIATAAKLAWYWPWDLCHNQKKSIQRTPNRVPG